MAVTVKITESLPDAYPTIETGITSPSAAFLAAVWQRIESYISERWAARDCVFIAEGPGDWRPPLQPATISATDLWNSSDAWETVTLRPTATGGYVLDGEGPYRITASVGSADDPPGAVQEAYKRLAIYLNENDGSEAGLQKSAIDGVGSFEFGSPNLAARAMQYSGAGDLLRPYRKLGGV